MSCYVIYYDKGVKKMRPVGGREEYLQLRGSRRQKELLKAARSGNTEAKKQLMQFNYSCIPGEDGMLKGCTQMSDTIGMDIDHIEPKLMAETALKILSMKDELGLMMLEKSARGEGYHLVMKRKTYMSQEENLQWASKKLGVEYDKGAKDITRVFFASTEEEGELIFLDPQLFTAPFLPCGHPFPQGGKESDSNDAERGNHMTEGTVAKGTVAEGTATEGTATEGASTKGASTKGASTEGGDGMSVTSASPLLGEGCPQGGIGAVSLPYSKIIPTFFKMEAAAFPDVPEGTRNDTIFNVVAKYLRYCTDHSFGKIKALIYPEYSFGLPEAEVDAIITSALSRERSLTPKVVKEVLAKNRSNSSLTGIEGKIGKGMVGGADEDDDSEFSSLTDNWTPPEVPKRIPRLMNLLTSNYDPRFRQMLLLSALPVLSAHASHFRARYLNGKVIGPQQYVAVIGGSGQGKGNCTSLYQEMVQYTLQNNDEREWDKVKENAELRDKKANAKERPAKYHPKLRLFETTSKSSILELQTNLGRNGMLLGQFSEVDGLSSASRAAYSDISVLLRKGWDMDMHRQFYMSDASCNTYVQMSISLLMAGTVRAMLERMFSDNNCEGGMMQRCIPVLLPKTKRTFRPPRQNFLSDDEKKERDALIINLYQKDLALGDETQLLDTPMTNRAIGAWFDELEELYNDGELTEAEADLSHRCGEFMLRAAIPLIALYGKETKEIVDFAVWVGRIAHYGMCRIFGHRVQKDIRNANELLANRLDARKTAEPLLDKMPDVFTVQQFKQQRVKEGQSAEVKMLLSRYCKNGKLQRVGRGVYRKGNIVSVTKHTECTSDLNENEHTD